MRLWARVVRNSMFTLIGICLTVLGAMGIIVYPLSVIVGLSILLISIMVKLIEETKPIIMQNKSEKTKKREHALFTRAV